MTSFKQLLVRLNQAVRPNMGNALFALFLTLICETALGMLFAAPAMLIIGREGADINRLIFAGLLLFATLLIWLLFQYGFHILILRMVRHEYVTLGYVFYGLKRIRKTFPLVVTIALIVVALTVAVVAGGRLVVARTGLSDAVSQLAATDAALSEPEPAAPSEEALAAAQGDDVAAAETEPLLSQDDALGEVLWQTGILLAVYALLLAVVFIRFVFVFYLHADNPDDRVLTLFKKSARLMRKNYLRLIRLALRAGGRNLVVAAVVFGITLAIPATNESGSGRGGLSLVVMLLNFVYFVNAYTALLKMYFAFPVLYTDVTATDELPGGDKDSIVLSETVALLTNDGDVPSDGE